MVKRTTEDEVLDVADVAAICKTSVNALHCQRSRGDGPPFAKVGRKLLIRRQVLMDWIDARAEPASK